MKKFFLILPLFVLMLSACVHNTAHISSSILNEKLAEETVSFLNQEFPPAHTHFYIQYKKKHFHEKKLISLLREKGYGIWQETPNPEGKSLELTYNVDRIPLEKGLAFRVVVSVDGKIASCFFHLKENRLIPLSIWALQV